MFHHKQIKKLIVYKALMQLRSHCKINKKTHQFFKSLFIFYLIPLGVNLRPFPIKIIKHPNGKADSHFVQIIKEITKNIIGNSPCINLKYLSTDGWYRLF